MPEHTRVDEFLTSLLSICKPLEPLKSTFLQQITVLVIPFHTSSSLHVLQSLASKLPIASLLLAVELTVPSELIPSWRQVLAD